MPLYDSSDATSSSCICANGVVARREDPRVEDVVAGFETAAGFELKEPGFPIFIVFSLNESARESPGLAIPAPVRFPSFLLLARLELSAADVGLEALNTSFGFGNSSPKPLLLES